MLIWNKPVRNAVNLAIKGAPELAQAAREKKAQAYIELDNKGISALNKKRFADVEIFVLCLSSAYRGASMQATYSAAASIQYAKTALDDLKQHGRFGLLVQAFDARREMFGAVRRMIREDEEAKSRDSKQNA